MPASTPTPLSSPAPEIAGPAEQALQVHHAGARQRTARFEATLTRTRLLAQLDRELDTLSPALRHALDQVRAAERALADATLTLWAVQQ